MSKEFPPSPMEIHYRRLDAYLTRINKEGFGWKDMAACVGRWHRNNEKDSPYTSQSFYDPKKNKQYPF